MKQCDMSVWEWIGLRNAVRRLTFELELSHKQELDMETAGSAATRSSGGKR